MPKPRKNSGSEPPYKPAALRAMMKHTLGGLGPNKRSDEHRAQELVYDAMEASTSERRLLLVRQALELDPENVDALRMLGETSDLRGEERNEALRGTVAAGAKRLGKKAFNELVPHFWGFHETRPYMRARQAQELDPLSRVSNLSLGWILWFAGEYDEVVTLTRKMNEFEEGFYGTHWILGGVHMAKREYAEACREIEKAVELGGGPLVIARLAQARGLAGDSGKAREGLDRLQVISRETFVPAFAYAIVYSGLGDNDLAFECLDRACQERNANLVYLNVDPTLHSCTACGAIRGMENCWHAWDCRPSGGNDKAGLQSASGMHPDESS
jgi:tetratricopeptide (TPR) repeat protein